MRTTQAEQLYKHLRRKPHTYMEMLLLGVSVSPWKRLLEGTHHLGQGEKIVRGHDKHGRATFAVKRG